jgi:hypothetical protein
LALHLFPLPGLKSPATSLRASGPETRTTATAEGAGEVARATMVSPSPVEGPGGKNEVGGGGEEVADGFAVADAAVGGIASASLLGPIVLFVLIPVRGVEQTA